MLTDKQLCGWRPIETAPFNRNITATEPATGEKVVKIKAATLIPVRKLVESDGAGLNR